MTLLTIGVIGTSLKENERRVPIHPDQFSWISEGVRKNLLFEQGYGQPFGIEDEHIAEIFRGTVRRETLFEQSDVVLIPKPMQRDFDLMRNHGVLWGWAHLVQQENLAQTAIDRHLTVITWESMNVWSPAGEWLMHIFYKNNEIAGYAGVQHALGLTGLDGSYGPMRKALVINFGSVSRGALYALLGRGFRDITVFTFDPPTSVANQITDVKYRQLEPSGSGAFSVIEPDGTSHPFIEELSQADIIVNGTFQDTDSPLMFVEENEVGQLKPGSLIIDISCDEGMGFPFAKPTSFENPMFEVGNLKYYAVDHTPSYLWNSASWEISKAILPFLPIVMAGPGQWEQNETIRQAIEMHDGVIENSRIITFQKRERVYPHARKAS